MSQIQIEVNEEISNLTNYILFLSKLSSSNKQIKETVKIMRRIKERLLKEFDVYRVSALLLHLPLLYAQANHLKKEMHINKRKAA